jgi:hypothetical protein
MEPINLNEQVQGRADADIKAPPLDSQSAVRIRPSEDSTSAGTDQIYQTCWNRYVAPPYSTGSGGTSDQSGRAPRNMPEPSDV